MPDGSIIEKYHRLHYPHESVGIVAVNEKNEILLVQSKRYATMRLEWEIPAGRVEDGESMEEAARRECMEETGCTLSELTYLCCHNPSNGMSDLKENVFLARVKSENALIDTNEVNTKAWFSKEQVLKLLKDNETRDGISILALLYAIQFHI